MTGVYVVAGSNHFIHPGTYLQIMPSWLPHQLALIYISGFCEIIFGLLLLPLTTRRIAAWCIILLLVAVFPANIQMSINYFHDGNSYRWLTILRLPLQLLLIRWAWLFARKNDIQLA